MFRLLLSLGPAGLVHRFGTGRALENARRDHVELALTMARIDALAGRIPPAGRIRTGAVAPADASGRAAA